ncbi:tetratricopeptide repeat protein [Pseudorhodoplanes sp.]|uniref:tetratricopeptide repeat protein n=1 Tax=Pseudorhodoplanes sp. TaxID=1934341 RepID=UPI002C5C66D9|nr:tetratricopeptide repeat protein [Pseudorhodoplanes sp.]HWV51744.1 tetratricopeptide repeat protein [Pseudorhodoplanes sp.]
MRGRSGRLWRRTFGGMAAALLVVAATIHPVRAEPATTAGDQQRLAEYDATLARNPDDRAALIARARLRTRTGNINGAIADYGRAVALRPEAALYRQRAALLLLRTDYRMAINDLDQAIRLDPDDGAALLLRGQARETLGARQGALADYRKALTHDPRNAEAHSAASRLAAILPQQPSEQPDITGSVPPAGVQPTKPDIAPPVRSDTAGLPPAAITPQQDTPLRIVRGGVASEMIASSGLEPGIYHLPDAPDPETAPPQSESSTQGGVAPPPRPRQHAARSAKPTKPPLRREARNRTPGFNDAFGGIGRR